VKEETEHRSPETATAAIDAQAHINAVRARRVEEEEEKEGISRKSEEQMRERGNEIALESRNDSVRSGPES
jgi:hypothetical protein